MHFVVFFILKFSVGQILKCNVSGSFYLDRYRYRYIQIQVF